MNSVCRAQGADQSSIKRAYASREHRGHQTGTHSLETILRFTVWLTGTARLQHNAAILTREGHPNERSEEPTKKTRGMRGKPKPDRHMFCHIHANFFHG